MEYEIQQLRTEVNQRLNNLEIAMSNQQISIVNLIQTLNSQITLLNQVTQMMNQFNNKLSDIEIRTTFSDDVSRELIESNTLISNELQDLRQSIEAIKFYSNANSIQPY